MHKPLAVARLAVARLHDNGSIKKHSYLVPHGNAVVARSNIAARRRDQTFHIRCNKKRFCTLFCKLTNKVSINMNPFLYRLLLPRRYKRYLSLAEGDKDKCHETLRYGTYYEEYDRFDFAHKSREERDEYVTDAYRNKLCRRINDAAQQAIVMDKYRTADLFRDYYRREFILCSSLTDEEAFVGMGLKFGTLVAKPVDACGGRGIRILKESDQQGWCARFAELMADSHRYIVEELIVQDPFMARWNPSSVNTVRLNTINSKGRIAFLSANMRCGSQGAFVDNCVQGGYCANIDPATGLIITTASGNEIGRHYSMHPDSGIPFQGEQIPRWKELLDAAAQMARRLDKTAYVSWDFALAAQGWTLVEANKGELIADQVNLGHGLRKELLRLSNEL